MKKEEHEVIDVDNAFLFLWISEYVACTTSTQVVLEYNCYVAKIMKGILAIFLFFILLLMYRLLFDVYIDMKSMSQKDNLKGTVWVAQASFYGGRSQEGPSFLLSVT